MNTKRQKIIRRMEASQYIKNDRSKEISVSAKTGAVTLELAADKNRAKKSYMPM